MQRYNTLIVSFAVCVLLLLQSCGSLGQQSGRKSVNDDRGGNFDACALIAIADVESALKEKFQSPHRATETVNGEIKPVLSHCHYDAVSQDLPVKYVDIEVRRPRANDKPTLVFTNLKRIATTEPRKITGIGEVAFWGNIGAESLPHFQLHVFKGQGIYLVITIGGFKDESKMLDGAKALAIKALASL